MSVSDQLLGAYVDGELSADQASAVASAAAADPALAERLAAHRRLRQTLASSFAEVAEAPVPERLLRAVAAGGEQPSNVTPLRPRPQRTAPSWAWMSGGALAAGLAAGVLIGPTVLSRSAPPLVDSHMAPHGALAVALASQLASDQAGRAVRIGVTFRAVDGRMCRTFESVGESAGAQGMAGLACHNIEGGKGGADWSVRMVVPAQGSDTGAYATAASRLPPPVAELAQSLAAAAPLNAAAEVKARATGWR